MRSVLSRLSPRCVTQTCCVNSINVVSVRYMSVLQQSVAPEPPTAFHPAMSEPLSKLLSSCSSLVVVSGAGISTESGIPDYRSPNRPPYKPLQFQAFVSSHSLRQRYWARSFFGYSRIRDAHPNGAHAALAKLEEQNRVHHIVTQNVDSLHIKAGSKRVVELHGSLRTVKCMDSECGEEFSRDDMQMMIEHENPQWILHTQHTWMQHPSHRPDGDIVLEDTDGFTVPKCPTCSEGMLKPGVVFFGESIPRLVVASSLDVVGNADGLLILGSSMQVWSAFRLARLAREKGIPIGVVNIGPTRADELASFTLQASVRDALEAVL